MSNGEVRRWWLRSKYNRNTTWYASTIKEYHEGYSSCVEVMRVEDHERIVAELKAEIERLELVAMATAESIKEKYKIMDTQKRVIEKLKIIDRDFAWHYEECSGAIDDDEFCDCGLCKVRSEIDAIERGEG